METAKWTFKQVLYCFYEFEIGAVQDGEYNTYA